MVRHWECAAAVLALLIVSLADGFSVKLVHLSTVYLPSAFGADGRSPEFNFQSNAVEKATFDPSAKIVYAIGERVMFIIDATDPKNLTRITQVISQNLELTDVALGCGAVFVSYVDKNNLLQGGVLQYGLYNRSSGVIDFVRDIKIGTQPDMLLATKNCTLVVALENPAVEVNSRLRDPPGGVGIVRFPQGVSGDPVVKILNFTAFDGRFDDLAPSGVRWVYRNNDRFSNDLEPEYVTFNSDQTKAFIGLQENNAIAVVDLVTDNITNIFGLGFKNWAQSSLDPSDQDNGINMAPWSVYGMYQPDGIQWFRWSGKEYIVTANEGGSKEYDLINFEESKRGNEFMDYELSPTVSAAMKEALQNNAKLGRLKLSSVDGKNQERKFEKFYTYGARSFSIWRASDMTQVFDSGDTLSRQTMEARRELFNNDVKDGGDRVADGMDKRSDDKGVEPESVAVAEVKGYLLMFVGLEKPGTIAVYSVAPGDELKPRFESLYTGGIPAGNSSTWAQLYAARSLHAVDPESISFIGTDAGLADFPMLLVTGVESGTVSLLKVDISGSVTISGSVLGSLLLCVLAMLSVS